MIEQMFSTCEAHADYSVYGDAAPRLGVVEDLCWRPVAELNPPVGVHPSSRHPVTHSRGGKDGRKVGQ